VVPGRLDAAVGADPGRRGGRHPRPAADVGAHRVRQPAVRRGHVGGQADEQLQAGVLRRGHGVRQRRRQPHVQLQDPGDVAGQPEHERAGGRADEHLLAHLHTADREPARGRGGVEVEVSAVPGDVRGGLAPHAQVQEQVAQRQVRLRVPALQPVQQVLRRPHVAGGHGRAHALDHVRAHGPAGHGQRPRAGGRTGPAPLVVQADPLVAHAPEHHRARGPVAQRQRLEPGAGGTVVVQEQRVVRRSGGGRGHEGSPGFASSRTSPDRLTRLMCGPELAAGRRGWRLRTSGRRRCQHRGWCATSRAGLVHPADHRWWPRARSPLSRWAGGAANLCASKVRAAPPGRAGRANPQREVDT